MSGGLDYLRKCNVGGLGEIIQHGSGEVEGIAGPWDMQIQVGEPVASQSSAA